VTNGRRRKNTIFSLEDGGNHITGDDNLIKHATKFYKNLFDPEDGNVFTLDPSLWNEDDFVTEEENMEKIKPFAEEEIKKALLLWKKQGCWARWVPY
jgi:hypothetical protein